MGRCRWSQTVGWLLCDPGKTWLLMELALAGPALGSSEARWKESHTCWTFLSDPTLGILWWLPFIHMKCYGTSVNTEVTSRGHYWSAVYSPSFGGWGDACRGQEHLGGFMLGSQGWVQPVSPGMCWMLEGPQGQCYQTPSLTGSVWKLHVIYSVNKPLLFLLPAGVQDRLMQLFWHQGCFDKA